MNRSLWKIKQSLRYLLKNTEKTIAGIFFRPSVDRLKTMDYQGLPANIDWQRIAGERQVHVEIGSGHGEVLLANDADKSIIVGYEIKSRFFRLSQRKAKNRKDVFIFKGSGYESLFTQFRSLSIDRIFILFPDPWHKKKHAKRRPLTKELFLRATQKLKNSGQIIIATDWLEYAQFIQEEAEKVSKSYEVSIRAYNPDEFGLPITHYHQKWARKGRKFVAIVLTKRSCGA